MYLNENPTGKIMTQSINYSKRLLKNSNLTANAYYEIFLKTDPKDGKYF